MIWLRRLGWLLGGVLALVMAAVAAVYLVTTVRMSKRYDVAAAPIAVPRDSAGLARGRHLAGAIAKCVACHGEDFGGAVMADDWPFGRLVASNLTSGKGGVGPRYDDAAMGRAIRHGIRYDGTPLRVMPSEAFQYLADDDVEALIGYIRSVPPVDRELPSMRIGPVARVISLLTTFPLIPARVVDHQRVPAATMPEAPTTGYGQYLANVGGCTGCHGPGLSGGQVGPGRPASNLTPAGIGTWTEEDFRRALREGMRPGGVAIDSAMPWRQAGRMTDSEIHALWVFLKSVPPKEFGNR